MYTISFPKLGITLHVSPTALKIGPIEIKWYAICIMIGFILALVYCLVEGKKQGVKSDTFIDIAIIAMVFGLIGARLYYVLFRLDEYIKKPISILYIWNGGLAIYGGVILAVFVGFLYCRRKKLPFPKLADIVAPALLIGQACGRWGNFFNQEAFGINTDLPWGMTGNTISQNIRREAAEVKELFGIALDSSKPVHPTFLYESLWCFIGIFVLWFFARKFKAFDGELALFYCAWYGFERMFVEGLRTDSLMLLGNIRVSQLFAFLTLVASVTLMIIFRVRAKKRAKLKLATAGEVSDGVEVEAVKEENSSEVREEATKEEGPSDVKTETTKEEKTSEVKAETTKEEKPSKTEKTESEDKKTV